MTMKTAISLPDKLFKEADRFAKKRNMSRSELIAKALSDYLNDEKRKQLISDHNWLAGETQDELEAAVRAQGLRTLRQVEW